MIVGKNLGLITLRLNGTGKDFVCLATRHVIEKGSLPRGNYSLFPLHLFEDQSPSKKLGVVEPSRPNFGPAFLRKISLDLANETPTPEDIFHYAYGVFHSPTYRSRYAEFLKIDFPRLPLTSSIELFRALAALGGELVSLHLMESPKLEKHITQFQGSRNAQVEKVTWSDDTVWLDKAQTTGFAAVPEPVWNFHIGGYQVCEKWLKDRKGRTLSAEDIAHYHKIVVALSETIHLMSEIDAVIESHGGWPLKYRSAICS
jgi:predicted helicase